MSEEKCSVAQCVCCVLATKAKTPAFHNATRHSEDGPGPGTWYSTILLTFSTRYVSFVVLYQVNGNDDQ